MSTPAQAPDERETTRRTWPATLLALGCALLFVLGLATDNFALRMATKPWPVLALGWLLLSARSDGAARRVALGLGLSALGDVLLESSPKAFIPGLIAFLLAHVAYVAAFLGVARQLRPAHALWPALFGATVLTMVWPGLGAMTAPVVIYTFVICTMLWRAACCAGTPASAMFDAPLAILGGWLFAFSDALIAFDRFASSFEGVRYAIIGLYWSGQLGIVLAFLRGDTRQRAES